jgi:hypothetical protein
MTTVLTTYLLATDYDLLATDHDLLATDHDLLATDHDLLATDHDLLATDHNVTFPNPSRSAEGSPRAVSSWILGP